MPIEPPLAEVFELGYAVPLYDISHDLQLFRHGQEERRVRRALVPMDEYRGLPVAKWEDVLKASVAEKMDGLFYGTGFGPQVSAEQVKRLDGMLK